MGKTYTADSFKTTSGEDLVLSKQAKIINIGSVGNAENNLLDWQFDTSDRLHLAVIGDSISMGAWSDVLPVNWINKGFAGMMQKSLRRCYGDGGLGFVGLYDTSHWTKVGSWGNNADFAPFGYCYYSSNSGMTFTLSNVTGDNMEIYYVNNSAVTFSYAIDGGSDVVVNSSGTYDNHIAKVAFSLGSYGAHSIVVKGATSGTLFLVGASVYTGTEGVIVHKIALSGEIAASGVYNFDNRFSVMAQHFSPKLTFLNFLANDFVYQDLSNSFLPAYETHMNTLAVKIKALGSDLIIWQPPKGTKLPNLNTWTLAQYEEKSKLAATNNDAVWVDLHNDWGDSNLDKMYDDQHPNEKGHKYIAALMLRVLRLFT